MKLEIDYKKKNWKKKKKKPHRFVVEQHATEQPWIKEQIKKKHQKIPEKKSKEASTILWDKNKKRHSDQKNLWNATKGI